ncbi:Homoserine kinase [Geodia barretti]|uniref:Homoserine kinase n=1 Tax=Geodia barretti TaxID=519541 RepID=A0AA35TM12_GEOBA|nr:Homoserine kinase [Geodia barretti]
MAGISVRAPSSTANLGPGFDVFGLALDAYFDEVTLERTGGGISILSEGGIPTDPDRNTAGIVARVMMERFGITGGVEIRIRKGVPVGFGMGSSAASAAAAAVAFDGLFDLGLDGDTLVECAGAGERASAGAVHYDNVAASVLGGFVIVRTGPLSVIRVDPPEDLVLCVAIPEMDVPPKKTQVSRGAVPERIAMADGVRNLANAAAMVAGFLRGEPEVIGSAIQDVIVEPARKHMIPGFDRVKGDALGAGALGVTISGAGPSVIALLAGSADSGAVADAMRGGFSSAGLGCRTVICGPSGGARPV